MPQADDDRRFLEANLERFVSVYAGTTTLFRMFAVT
ncbi:hypothetical protein SAMN05216236_15224 [Sedimentitalea nanhaiensis]|uniref:Uncharacterized protein n=1 Tax=Sedimentitalea nanhaiensis TaxID=999627 RepID=A0A1I7E9I8_9RHOB|nr:hypothetical protein SAMN05216236_15224 [Sedimentitalea nanhaiensis]